MEQVIRFFYLMGVLAVVIISILKYNGGLELIPNNFFLVLYIPMLILMIAVPFVRRHENNNQNSQGN